MPRIASKSIPKTAQTSRPDFSIERAFAPKLVCGIDEAGRGPLAGPVVAAAVILPPDTPESILAKINDSKKLTAGTRATLHAWITQNSSFGVGEASVDEIDALNILQATFLAMQRAVMALPTNAVPGHALIDGNRLPKAFPVSATAVIGGDGKSLSIAAASIVAKHHRDTIMHGLHLEYPAYNWQKNAGYGTEQHRTAISQIGLSTYHRKTFTKNFKKEP